jgi:hypothetical protein
MCSVASNWTNESLFAREQVSIVRQVLESPAMRELIVANQSPRMCGALTAGQHKWGLVSSSRLTCAQGC